MQLDPQAFLRLCEAARTIGFIDIEATGLRGDYNSVLVVSVRRFHSEPTTFAIRQAGNDQRVVRDAKRELESLDCWVTYYGKGFDLPMLNTRLLRWGVEPIAKRHHVDMYYTLKSNLLTARRSQGHLLSWLGTADQKMGVSAEAWNEVLTNPRKAIPTMIARCDSDTAGLQGLYEKTRHLIRDIKL